MARPVDHSHFLHNTATVASPVLQCAPFSPRRDELIEIALVSSGLRSDGLVELRMIIRTGVGGCHSRPAQALNVAITTEICCTGPKKNKEKRRRKKERGKKKRRKDDQTRQKTTKTEENNNNTTKVDRRKKY